MDEDFGWDFGLVGVFCRFEMKVSALDAIPYLSDCLRINSLLPLLSSGGCS